MNAAISKKNAAKEAVEYIRPFLTEEMIIGIGTGSTVNYFIEQLAALKNQFGGAVASSKISEDKLRHHGIALHDLNTVSSLRFYIDGADEATRHLHLIKGGGAALTREKIVAAVSEEFLCIVDESKLVNTLGAFPLPIEVIPMARSYVARELVKLGGSPEYRQGVITDNHNVILDVWGLDIIDPKALEWKINHITGVVTNGLFAQRGADILFLGKEEQVMMMKKSL